LAQPLRVVGSNSALLPTEIRGGFLGGPKIGLDFKNYAAIEGLRFVAANRYKGKYMKPLMRLFFGV
jgi:hypothetical protein